MSAKYLKDFFAEKTIDREARFEVMGPSGVNSMPYGVVIDAIHTAPANEQDAIANTLRRIDFANGDVTHYLRHLGQALAI